MQPPDLPIYSEVELQLAARAARLAAIELKATGGEINEVVWRHYPQAAEEMIQEDSDPDEVRAALNAAEERLNIPPTGTSLPLPANLDELLIADFRTFQAHEPPDTTHRLDEKWIKSISEFRIEIYHNESKHRGFPHVKVSLEDGDINVSISANPKVVAGRKGLRGEAAALNTVKKHRRELKRIWDDTRPDDQKLKR